MAHTKDAVEFNKIIQDERDKKRKQELADKIFGRRSSAPAAGVIGGGRKAPPGPKPLSQRITAGPTGVAKPSRPTRPVNAIARTQSSHATLHRSISTPLLHPNSRRRNQALDAAINGSLSSSSRFVDHANVTSRMAVSNGAGISVRGSASIPQQYTVVAQNFAPGTTAEDIESVFAPDPGSNGLVSCRLLVTTPTVIAEVVFDNQEAAEEVVKTFNNKKADNRILHVYHRDPPTYGASRAPQRTANRQPVIAASGDDVTMEVDDAPAVQQGRYSPPRGPRAQTVVQDGRYGFSDDIYRPASPSSRGNGGGLVSDGMIPRAPRARRGDGGGYRGGSRHGW